MIPVFVPYVAAMIAKMNEVQMMLSVRADPNSTALPLFEEDGKPSKLFQMEIESVGATLGLMQFEIAELHLNPLLIEHYERLKSIITNPEKLYGAAEVNILFRELQRDIMGELTRNRFLMIEPDDKELYIQKEPLFGQKVADNLPEANYDIAAAGRCLALDEWTASVFHCTRALEIGLQQLATDVSVSDADQENWYKLIQRIEDAIKAMRNPQSALTSDDRERLEWLSKMAGGFTYFKTAWRNPVSHSRGKYDGREARDAWDHVRIFIQTLTRGPQ